MGTTTTTTLQLLLGISLLLLLLSPSVLSKKKCHPDDMKALLQLKKDLNNPYIVASWLPEDEYCCDWYCVDCDANNRIITVSLYSSTPDLNFSSQIPPSIANLPYLSTLEFHKFPKLTGPLQPAIAKLTRLSFLRISWTNLSGPVPDFLGRMKSLTYIDLSFNNLTGSIPGSLSQLPKLGYLNLGRNHLTGPIPPSFGLFKSNPDIYLSHNSLSGPIPHSFFSLNITRLELSRNMLVGDASGLFGPNKGTERMDLSRNQFEFDFGKVKGFSSNLIYLDLNHNKLYGNIPESLTKVENLQTFNVSYNRLCGQIPQGGQLQRFDVYDYFHNKCLCGPPLPPCNASDYVDLLV